MTRPRLARVAVTALAVLVLCGLLDGCGAISSIINTQQGLHNAGFQSVHVGFNLTGGSDVVNVSVTVSAPATEADTTRAAMVVWQDLHQRFSALNVTVHGTTGEVKRTFQFAEMQALFGPRNPAWNRQTLSTAATHLGLEVLIGILVVVALVVVLAVTLARRRRRRAPPWSGHWPPPGVPPWQPGPPGQGGPPNWSQPVWRPPGERTPPVWQPPGAPPSWQPSPPPSVPPPSGPPPSWQPPPWPSPPDEPEKGPAPDA